MQGYPLTNTEDRALPLSEKILPQYLKDLGYSTHLVGKWHVGLARAEYLPTFRGFDTHFAHRGGYIDYYEYNLMENWDIGDVSGFDLFRNMTAASDVIGYITDVYNEEAKSIIPITDVSQPLFLMVARNTPHSANDGAPMQAPPEDEMRHIELLQRRFYGGMQGYPLTNAEDRALPLSEKILPQYLKDLSYATHLVGKWHVGQARAEYLPTFRGFDTHFGHRGSHIDYYEYNRLKNWETGLGLFRNMTAAWDVEGYITDVYNEEAKSIIRAHDVSQPLFLMVAHNAPHAANDGAPMQAPPEEVRAMRHIELPQRRLYGAMVKKLDDSIGDIVKTLLEKGIIDNTIIVFISDNGGMTSQMNVNYASNYPLRGLKMSPYEGGIRVNGLVWSRNLTESKHLWKGYMHVADWLPTLLRATGEEPLQGIDGVDLWDSITTNGKSKRDLIVEIDDYTGFYSIIRGDYKLVIGTILAGHSNHQGKQFQGTIGELPSYENAIRESAIYSVLSDIGIPFDFNNTVLRNDIMINCTDFNSNQEICHPTNSTWCLYNIKKDPCELIDLTATHSDVAKALYEQLQTEIARTIPRKVPYEINLNASPSLHNYTWDIWFSSD